MSVKLLDTPAELLRRRQFTLFDDFFGLDEVERWSVTADAGTQDIDLDGRGGLLSIATGSTDNDEAYVATIGELFRFAPDKPIEFEARIKFVEANTDDANVLVGLMDAPGADSLLDDGGGPKSSYSGAVIYEVDGGTNWTVESSLGGAQTTTLTDQPAGGAAFHTLRIVVQPVGPDRVEVTFFIDPLGGSNFAQCRDAEGRPVKHVVALGSPTEMAVVLGAKAGGANAETLLVDYVSCSQLR
ncbi:MAG: hypothetical protein RIC55_21350 [Pirellulaceae bacterium]